MLKTTDTKQEQKTTIEKTNEFPVRLQGAFALAQAIQMVENVRDELTEEEYESQMQVIAEIAVNLADVIPEA
tara:strand:- start:1367 stop:1582 length:216 start_codon:yes stop_codon:yes gene_type:complete